ncbi:MAG: ribonuclease HII [Deltaproteobacteria bacterium]|nr:ribonuclease HII [Deltaproteobacteria bacterium]
MDSLIALLQETVPPEQALYDLGYSCVAGVDEAGRGPLAGPVVAAAVIFSPQWTDPDIQDSKKLSPGKRQMLHARITREALAWSWALAEPQEIDRINILQASLAAMQRAVNRLAVVPEYIIVDGPHGFSSSIPQTPITGGDGKSLAIAAASIVAKVERDAIMQHYHSVYPRYNFARHKGYGTREHREAIAAHGRCPIHRTSFKIKNPVSGAGGGKEVLPGGKRP